MKEIISNILTYSAYAFGGYAAVLAAAELMENFFSKKITCQEQLDEIVNKEADKLGMDKRNIVSTYYSKTHPDYKKIRGARSSVQGWDREKDEIVFYDPAEHRKKGIIPLKVLEVKEGWGSNVGAVRHELYHLAKHLPRKRNFLKYFFYEEPTATIYSITGVKL
jgi:hypothetical protein